MGGKAELMGDTCMPVIFPLPFPASASIATEVERLDDIVEGLGVAGVFAVGTLPMNHDWKCGLGQVTTTTKEKHAQEPSRDLRYPL